MHLNINQTDFNTLFKNRGGILLPSDEKWMGLFNYYIKRSNNYIDSSKEHLNFTKAVPNIYFDFINNPQLNAVAAASNPNTYFIGVNYGSILIIIDLFHRMMVNPNILKHIGNPGLEIKNYPTIRNYYLDAEKLINFGDFEYKYLEHAIPIDNIRRTYAIHLANIAIDFIVAHELTHILNGHLGYIKSEFNIETIEEREYNINNNLLIYQTLEMDADCIAVSKGIANAMRRHLGIVNVSETFKPFYADFNHTVFDWTLSIFTLLRIMVESNIYNTGLTNSRNPNPRLRSTMVMKTIIAYLEQYYPHELKSLNENIFRDIILTVECAYSQITGNPENHEGIKDSLLATGDVYIDQVLNNWKEIRPELIKYSYVDLVE